MAFLEINLSKLVQNYQKISNLVDRSVRICAVVKDNAYGAGIQEVGRTLSNRGIDWLAVNDLNEALILRNNGVLQPILILGYTDPTKDIPEIIRNNFSVTLFDLAWAREAALAAQKMGKKIHCHLKIDTGMQRFGIYPHEIVDFMENIKYLNGIEIEGIYSHLAEAANRLFSEEQQDNFSEALFKLQSAGYPSSIAHLVSTNGIKTLPDAHYDMVRTGMGLLGYSKNIEGLKPIMSMKARIISLKRVPQNVTIGYNCTYKTTRSMIVAVAEVGYVDGIPRNASNKIKALFDGKIIPQVGMLCMNYSMFDVTGITNIKINDELTIISDENLQTDLSEIAKNVDSTVYELSARMPETLKRKYIGM